jgi:hypothetical protein
MRRLTVAVAAVAVTFAIAAPSSQAAPPILLPQLPSFCNGGIGTTTVSIGLLSGICKVLAHQACVRSFQIQGVPVLAANRICLSGGVIIVPIPPGTNA